MAAKKAATPSAAAGRKTATRATAATRKPALRAAKAAMKAAPAPESEAKSDGDFIQEAYGDAIRDQVQMLVNYYAGNTPEPEKKFSKGLTIIRMARTQALKSAPPPTLPIKTDVALVMEGYGGALKKLVDVLINDYTDGNPNPEQGFLSSLALVRKARDQATKLVQD